MDRSISYTLQKEPPSQKYFHRGILKELLLELISSLTSI